MYQAHACTTTAVLWRSLGTTIHPNTALDMPIPYAPCAKGTFLSAHTDIQFSHHFAFSFIAVSRHIDTDSHAQDRRHLIHSGKEGLYTAHSHTANTWKLNGNPLPGCSTGTYGANRPSIPP